MPQKRRAAAPKRVNAKVRARDEALREELRHFDVKKFAKVLAKAIKAPA